jgi:hypothetical protein
VRLGLENLEDRFAPANFTVTNLNATGAGSLEDAIERAILSRDTNNTITFANNLSGTITLDSQQTIAGNVNIVGPGSSTITISGGGPDIDEGVRPFAITSDSNVSISGVTVANGVNVGNGGAIYNSGTLTLTNVVLTNNLAGVGGAIYNASTGNLTVSGTTVVSNEASQGGGIYNLGTASISNSTIMANTATDWESTGGGGGVYNGSSGTISFTSSYVTSNSTSGTNANGGGIYNLGTCTMTGGSLDYNTTNGFGGGIYSGGGTATLVNGDIEYNSASQGGGFYAANGNCTLTNCTLSNNTVGFGANGGVWVGGNVTYTQSGGTITDDIGCLL